MGGTDRGMNPVELVLCSLGGCLFICARMLAEDCGVELNDLFIELEGDVDLSGCMEGAKDVEPGFEEVRFTININSNSPEDNIRDLVELMEIRCPVSDSLQRNIKVNGNYKTLQKV